MAQSQLFAILRVSQPIQKTWTAIATPATARHYSSLQLLVLMKYLKSTWLKNWNFILSLTHPLALSILFTFFVSSVKWSEARGFWGMHWPESPCESTDSFQSSAVCYSFPLQTWGKGERKWTQHGQASPSICLQSPHFPALPRQCEKLLTCFGRRSLLEWYTAGPPLADVPSASPQAPTPALTKYTGACVYTERRDFP